MTILSGWFQLVFLQMQFYSLLPPAEPCTIHMSCLKILGVSDMTAMMYQMAFYVPTTTWLEVEN